MGVAVAAVACGGTPVDLPEQAPALPVKLEQAERLSAFGERAAFSPDGTRIAFVGKAYGDAYEVVIATGEMRNLTEHLPHQGIARIQYLPNGDYLLTAPRRYIGPNSRVNLELWVLDKGLRGGLQPLGVKPFEGTAVSRSKNQIAWVTFDPTLTLKPDESWQRAFAKPTKRYVAEIVYENGIPQVVNQREIMPTLPQGCWFIEPQDFRDNDGELVFSCVGASPSGAGQLVSVMGHKIDSGETITYRSRVGEYNEVEGIAPEGDWATVECGVQDGAGVPELDICRLELTPDGEITHLVQGVIPGTTRSVSNPVVSPDGKWIAFQDSDSAVGEPGEGMGISVIRIAQ